MEILLGTVGGGIECRADWLTGLWALVESWNKHTHYLHVNAPFVEVSSRSIEAEIHLFHGGVPLVGHGR